MYKFVCTEKTLKQSGRKQCIYTHTLRIRLRFSFNIFFFFVLLLHQFFCRIFILSITSRCMGAYNSEFCLYLMNAKLYTWENYFNFNSMSFGFLCLCAHRIPYKSLQLQQKYEKKSTTKQIGSS